MPNPYYYEFLHHTTPPHFLSIKSKNEIENDKPVGVEKKDSIWIETQQELDNMIEDLQKEKEVAVDWIKK